MNTEKENTWRSLKGLKPIQPLKCRLGWHRWTSFEYFEGDPGMGYFSHATCHCADCGLPRVERPVSLLNKNKKNAD
jgi:hypothetical protein